MVSIQMDYTYYLIWGVGKPFQHCLRRIKHRRSVYECDTDRKIKANMAEFALRGYR